MSRLSTESYLVFGGSGFVGCAIVKALLARGETCVSVFDLVPKTFEGKVRVYTGDITDEEAVSTAIIESAATCIFHTVSPIHGLPPPIYTKVNIDGTRTLLSCAITHKIPKFVYTSTTGVVWTGQSLNGVDEKSASVVKKGWDAYHDTKAKAETMVLAANSREEDGLKTVSIRPCALFGPDDKQLMHHASRTLKSKQTHIQIGPNTAVMDFGYVDNIADAHLLAADKLPSRDDFSRIIWREIGDVTPPSNVRIIPKGVAIVLAWILAIYGMVMGTKPMMDMYNVVWVTITQVYKIDKAREVLGYEPRVGLEEGIKEMVKDGGYKNYQDEP
ncbi:hypothetical protein JAAARDRAFT_56368 [Jaapia argillacea MUCL 33604]|uniref:3-beta hydroxysteroid dehydrogenase/isomerase domain-containing protein n=1 Tax=Jaapia argillacea MUCL 33604 TaxID=933084 RepID=A0A067QD13_9AGAM|nr:hypothetical protein JAAARDRAFT_56368 [Jaapia argillacea MUCL 33604]